MVKNANNFGKVMYMVADENFVWTDLDEIYEDNDGDDYDDGLMVAIYELKEVKRLKRSLVLEDLSTPKAKVTPKKKQ